MKLNDQQIKFYDSTVLKIKPDKRDEYLGQADHLIGRLQAKIQCRDLFRR